MHLSLFERKHLVNVLLFNKLHVFGKALAPSFGQQLASTLMLMKKMWARVTVTGDKWCLRHVGATVPKIREEQKDNNKTRSELKKFTWFNICWKLVVSILKPRLTIQVVNPHVPTFLSLYLFIFTHKLFWLCVWVYMSVWERESISFSIFENACASKSSLTLRDRWREEIQSQLFSA